MSNLFTKNRESMSSRWEKKPAVNSQNDRFTIYAHMQPMISTINNPNSYQQNNMPTGNNNNKNSSKLIEEKNAQLNYNCRLNVSNNVVNRVDSAAATHKLNNQLGQYEYEQQGQYEADIPLTHHQVAKMKETLNNFYKANNTIQNKVKKYNGNSSSQFDNCSSNLQSIHNSRNAQIQKKVRHSYIEPNDEEHGDQYEDEDQHAKLQKVNRFTDRQQQMSQIQVNRKRNKKYSNQSNIPNHHHHVNMPPNYTERSPYDHYQPIISHNKSNIRNSGGVDVDDYNSKLDIMKQRLEQISKKQYEIDSKNNTKYTKNTTANNNNKNDKNTVKSPNSSIGSAFSKSHTHVRAEVPSHAQSQHSTKRQNYHQYYNRKNQQAQHRDKDDNLLNQMSKNMDVFKEHKRYNQNSNANQNMSSSHTVSLQRSKNTTPMPTIIHEQQPEIDNQYRISSTVLVYNHLNQQIDKTFKQMRQKQKDKQGQTSNINKQALTKIDNYVQPNKDKQKQNKQKQKYLDMLDIDGYKISNHVLDRVQSQSNSSGKKHSKVAAINSYSAINKNMQNKGKGSNKANLGVKSMSNNNSRVHNHTPVSNKKNKQQYYYWELYPTLSEQVRHHAQANPTHAPSSYYQSLEPHIEQPHRNNAIAHNTSIKNGRNNRISHDRSSNVEPQEHKQQFRQARSELQSIKNSVWMLVDTSNKGKPYRNNSQVTSKVQPEEYELFNNVRTQANPDRHSLVESNKSAEATGKAKQSVRNPKQSKNNSINVSNRQGYIYVQQKHLQELVQQLNKGTSTHNKNNNINKAGSNNIQDTRNGRNLIKQKFTFGSQDIGPKLPQTIQGHLNMGVHKNTVGLTHVVDTVIKQSRIHRGPIRQIVIQEGELHVSVYTASSDYTIKHHTSTHTDPKQVCRHRAAIQSMLKIDNKIISAGRDMNIKCNTINSNSTVQVVSEKLYRMESRPIHLSCVNQNSLIVGCADRLCLFDIHNWDISKQVSMQGVGDYMILENRHKIYIGTSNSLFMFDHRSPNPMISMMDNFPLISRWIMHPFQQICLIHTGNTVQQLDYRMGRKIISQPASYSSSHNNSLNSTSNLSAGVNGLGRIDVGGQNIVSDCWVNNGSENKLLVLTQQQIQSNIYVNKLAEWDISATHDIKYINISQERERSGSEPKMDRGCAFMGSNRNSMSIVREWKGSYYLGDRVGNLYTVQPIKKGYKGRQQLVKSRDVYEQDHQQGYIVDGSSNRVDGLFYKNKSTHHY